MAGRPVIGISGPGAGQSADKNLAFNADVEQAGAKAHRESQAAEDIWCGLDQAFKEGEESAANFQRVASSQC